MFLTFFLNKIFFGQEATQGELDRRVHFNVSITDYPTCVLRYYIYGYQCSKCVRYVTTDTNFNAVNVWCVMLKEKYNLLLLKILIFAPQILHSVNLQVKCSAAKECRVGFSCS